MLILALKEHENAERDREAARIIVDMVKEKGLEDRVAYSAFSLDAGKEFIKLAPDSNVSYLRGDRTPEELKDLVFRGLDYNWFVMDDHPELCCRSEKTGADGERVDGERYRDDHE
jgi:glycerophosphoryl diester phosphodiesterase